MPTLSPQQEQCEEYIETGTAQPAASRFITAPARDVPSHSLGASPGALYPYLMGSPWYSRKMLPDRAARSSSGRASIDAGPRAAWPSVPSPVHSLSARGNAQWIAHEDAGLTQPLLAPHDAQAIPAAGITIPHTPLSRSLVFGAINTIATVPSMIAFASIVFKDPVYSCYVDLLCKFFFLASAIHQAVFCIRAKDLPFAVGQVQDVGLIFLSAMASSIAQLCSAAGRDAAVALGTSLVAMSVSTLLVGLATLAVARLKLAGLVQYMPLPVVGGYLGFVGYFCIASGIGLGCGINIDAIAGWAGLASRDALWKLLPTLGSCAALMITLEHVSSPWALPAVMTAIVLAFHGALWLLGMSLDEAHARGWAMRAAGGGQKFWELWGLYNIHSFSLNGVYIQAVFRQMGKLLGLVLVVCFGSCMDIAAVQQDVPQKIDFDRELTTVAISNMAAGVAGCGFTGSYIFSQTVFTMRAGVFSLWNGVVIVAAELTLFMLPFSVVQYMPNFFYGALLLWFGCEISRDWLFLSYFKLSVTEYVLLWLSFGTIMQLGLEVGIGVAIIMSALYFTYAYAKSQVTGLKLKPVRSGVVRTLEEQAALDLFQGRLAVARLRGFVFFGSAHSIGIRLSKASHNLVCGDAAALQRFAHSAEVSVAHNKTIVGEGYEDLTLTQALEALAKAPRFLVLDFTRATGLDATGARTFGMLCKDLVDLNITLVVTGLRHDASMRKLLVAHGVLLNPVRWPPPVLDPWGDLDVRAESGLKLLEEPVPFQQVLAGDVEGKEWRCLEFPTLEEGLRFCEDSFVAKAVQYHLCPSRTARVPLEALLSEVMPKVPITVSADPAQMAHILRRYLIQQRLAPAESLWHRGDDADQCYIIEEGAVRVVTYPDWAAYLNVHEINSQAGSVLGSEKTVEDTALPIEARSGVVVTHEYGPGCVVGKMDLYLRRPRISAATAITPRGCRVLCVSRSKLAMLGVEEPAALNLLQAVLMRATCRDLAVALERGSAHRLGGD